VSAVERNEVVSFVAGSLYGESPLSLEDAVTGALNLVDQFDDHGWTVHADREPTDDEIKIEFDPAIVPKWLTIGSTQYDVVPRSATAEQLANRFDEIESSASPQVGKDDERVAETRAAYDEPVDAEPIDTTNDMLVGSRGPLSDQTFTLMLPPAAGEPFSRDRALRLAAWLVALADPLDEQFPAVLDAVRST